MRARLAPITLALLAALAAAPLFLNSGFLNTRGGGDSPFLLFRLQQLYTALSQGVFPVRWMPDAAFGLGYPFFNYYAALPFYVAALFHAAGSSFVVAIKVTHLIGFIGAALGMVGWMRSANANRAASWLAAVAYTYAPFHLVNVYVRGDSLGEFWAFALFPLCLWAARRLADQPSYSRGLPLALAYAALLLTHNISALIFSPFLGLYILFLAISRQPSAIPLRFASGTIVSHQLSATSRHSAFIILNSAFAFTLGLALSAFFWLPALRETGFGQLGAQTTGYFHYSNHFRGRDLVQLSPLFNYDVGSTGTTPFAMGLAQAALVALGLIALAYGFLKTRLSAISQRPSAISFIIHHSSFIILSFLLSTFMITRYSEPLWANLPLLPFVQFPWRFLSVQSVFASAIIGLAIQPATDGRPQTTVVRRLSATVITVFIILSSLLALRPDFIAIADSDVTAERLQLYEYFTGNIGTTIRYEYLPTLTQPRPYSSEEFIRGTASLKLLSGDAVGSRIEKRAASQTWAVTVNSASASVAVPLLYWPGWEARADGEKIDTHPAGGLGWIAFDLPKGAHTVELKLGDTPTRRAAATISLIALAVVIVLAQPWKLLRANLKRGNTGSDKNVIPSRVFRGEESRLPDREIPRGFAARNDILAVGSAIVLIAITLIGRGLSALPQPGGAATMDFDQQGYLSSSPVRFNNGDTLVDYNYSAETAAPGDLLGVSMLWQGRGRGAFDLALVSPAEHLLNLPATFAQTGGPAEGRVGAVLPIPSDLPPGVYLLRLKLTEAGINAPALTSGGQPRGALYLRPVRIDRALTDAVGGGTAITPTINLVSALAAQTDSSAVSLALNWQATAPVPANYVLALRLRDQTGAELAALDAQPTGGIYPTNVWRAGEIVPDHYRFDLPLGLPPGDYPLTLTLYDAASLAPAGTATVPVHLSLWSPPPGAEPLYRFTDTLALHDVLLPDPVKAGDALHFAARWSSLASLPHDLLARWNLINSNGEVTAVADLPLASIPSSQWAAGALVLGRPSVSVPYTAKQGEYTLSAQLLAPDGTLLSSAVTVGKVIVTASKRTDQLPPMQFTSGAAFGPITLAGYDLALDAETLTLTLHWQAAGAAAADYKYFVHVFNPADESIAAQSDSYPALPTSQWFVGEVVGETTSLPLDDLESGTLYNIGLGWYDPASGGRLGERVILNQGVIKP